MIQWALKKVFGTRNERELKRIAPLVVQINQLEPKFSLLSADQLKAKTLEFKQRVANGEPLNSLIPESFAVVREASKRALGLRHFDVQMVGGVVLHEGRIAEMKTGEGKTLVATLPVYLNALTGKGVHVVTVNDYLARRDAEWMGKIYKYLGLSVGVIVHGLNDTERAWGYRADVTYGTNNEFGFDYLRDNMKYDLAQYVQRDLNYAIVDEVDSILIDEARTPLIISGPAEQSTDLYYRIDRIIPSLKRETHFTVDEKTRQVMLTEAGVAAVEEKLRVDNLYDPANINLLHHTNQALRAHVLYKRDVDYVVKEGKVMIVDEFTGRLMPGRRWSDGLHQAAEATEKEQIENENQTLASITFQNYFRMYEKLSGMTGTADTEAAEFAKIYKLEVMVMPTHMPMVRKDLADVIYKTEDEKFGAVVRSIEEAHAKGQPVLVGTISIERSEKIAEMLSRRGVPHHVLNAKQHEKEAEIVAQAGRFGAVTIATNMAGRGTDIMLGGNPDFLAKSKMDPESSPEQFQEILEKYKRECQEEKQKVIEAGGLLILGTERHESRRIDNQLRGRSGRQGDPGASRFYLSLGDDLLRIFGGDRISRLMDRLGMEEGEPIEHPWLSKAIENAQKKVESHNFSIRKNILEYDDVMNLQRKTVYTRRREMLKTENTKDILLDMIDQMATQITDECIAEKMDPETFDATSFQERIKQIFDFSFSLDRIPKADWNAEKIGNRLYEQVVARYEEKEKEYGLEIFQQVERFVLLATFDGLWKDHLLQMDHLREGIGLRGYAQKDPLLEYKKEGYSLFQIMMNGFVEDVVGKIYRVRIASEQNSKTDLTLRRKEPMQMRHGGSSAFVGGPMNPLAAGGPAPESRGDFGGKIETVRHAEPKVGRNDLCPCGSGKKYKKCHGR